MEKLYCGRDGGGWAERFTERTEGKTDVETDERTPMQRCAEASKQSVNKRTRVRRMSRRGGGNDGDGGGDDTMLTFCKLGPNL